ncbi:MAG: hypothetical protein OEO23_06225 [Gemmatimonadota bacterium]|nr:hypothetical protein [Gemmatimonadota bacterium]
MLERHEISEEPRHHHRVAVHHVDVEDLARRRGSLAGTVGRVRHLGLKRRRPVDEVDHHHGAAGMQGVVGLYVSRRGLFDQVVPGQQLISGHEATGLMEAAAAAGAQPRWRRVAIRRIILARLQGFGDLRLQPASGAVALRAGSCHSLPTHPPWIQSSNRGV